MEETEKRYDPARRRRRATAAQMRGLRKAWAARRGGRRRRRAAPLYHPARRRRRTTRRRRLDPGIRSYRVYHPTRRRRRYDPFKMGGLVNFLKVPGLIAIGGIAHNWAKSRGIKIPFLPSTFSLGNIHVSDVGIVSLLGGLAAKYWLRNDVGDAALLIGSGAFGEGFTAPDIEGTVKAGVRNAGASVGGSYIPLGAYD